MQRREGGEPVPYARTDDTELHYETRGIGPPLLLLMGLGATGDLWGDAFLSALAARFRLLIVDNRGTGNSGRGGGIYSIARLAADAVAVLEKEGLLAAHVLGVSMGGMVAQELAVSRPSRVRGLVLGCTSPGGPEAELPRRSTMESLARQGLFGVSQLLVTPEYAAKRTGLLTRLAVRAMARPIPPKVIAEQLAAVSHFDVSERLRAIVAPTLVVTGDRDLLMPPENSRVLVRRIRGARGVVVKDTAHCFFWEAPERAAGAISEFLAPLSPVAVG